MAVDALNESALGRSDFSHQTSPIRSIASTIAFIATVEAEV
jgi:hypothetical protein